MINSSKGVTLVEMVIVVAVIAILASVLYVNFGKDSRYQANLTKAKAFATSIPVSMPTSFVSEWKFDGPTAAEGFAVAADLKDTWSANDGVPSAGTIRVKAEKDCVYGKCLEFSGGNYVNFADNVKPTSITISLWVYPTTIATVQSLVERTSGYAVRINSGKVRAVLNGTGGWHYYASSSQDIPLNVWIYIVMTYDSVSGKNFIYVNGDRGLETVIAGAITYSNSYPLRIGAAYDGTLSFAGKIDNVQIYKEALAISQIQSNYYAGLDSLYGKGMITAEEYQQKRGFCLASK